MSATSSPVDSAEQATRSATLEGLKFFAQTVSMSADKKVISVVLKVTNVSKVPIRSLFVGPRPTIIDDMANLAEASDASGIQVCTAFGKSFYAENPQWCVNSPRTGWTTLSPNFPVTVLLRFKAESPLSGKTLSFASTVLLEEGNEKNDTGISESHIVKQVSVSLAGLQMGNAR